jgi:HD superfamily phosphohydrolase
VVIGVGPPGLFAMSLKISILSMQVVSAPAVDVDRGDYLARDALHTHKQLSRGNYFDMFRGCRVGCLVDRL